MYALVVGRRDRSRSHDDFFISSNQSTPREAHEQNAERNERT